MLKLIDQSLLRSQLYIDGKWVSADDGATVSVFNPATKDEVIAAADAGAAETRRAIDAAETAFAPVGVKLLPKSVQLFLNAGSLSSWRIRKTSLN
jgi:acyl-CoA reductase-like NAD-dependent aldehyde dehydrogenase